VSSDRGEDEQNDEVRRTRSTPLSLRGAGSYFKASLWRPAASQRRVSEQGCRAISHTWSRKFRADAVHRCQMAAFASRRADTLSEIGPDRYETRKIEFWPDGRVGYASQAGASANTCLGDQPVPALEEINALAEFSGEEIDAAAFELLWHQHVTPRLSDAPEVGC
jgi:hypothetical protein